MKSLSHVQLFATPWTVAHQVPPSRKFSKQEYWNGWPFPSPGELPDPRIKPGSLALQAGALPSEPTGKPKLCKPMLISLGTRRLHSTWWAMLFIQWATPLISPRCHVNCDPLTPTMQTAQPDELHSGKTLHDTSEVNLRPLVWAVGQTEGWSW